MGAPELSAPEAATQFLGPFFSFSFFSFAAALLLLLLPTQKTCNPFLTLTAEGTVHTGLHVSPHPKPLSYWIVDGELPLEEEEPFYTDHFRLPPLTANNTAYSMIAVGGYAYHLCSLITVHSIRRWDKERDIVIHTTHKDLPTADIMAAATALGAKYNVVSKLDYEKVGDPLYNKGGMFYGCWLKFFVWGMTQYAAVINVDTDYIMLQS